MHALNRTKALMPRTHNSDRFFQTSKEAAFTLIELLCVIITILMCVGMLLPALAKDNTKAGRVKCENNLKNIGLAFHVFANDNGHRYPMAVPAFEGGTSEYATTASPFSSNYVHLRALSNELSTPKIVVCPFDSGRIEATNWNHLNNVGNKAVSYFVGLDADETQAQSMLAGDENITNDIRFSTASARTIKLGTNHTATRGAGWTVSRHSEHGYVLLSNGSVQYTDTFRLREQLKTSNTENIFAFPGGF